MLMPIDDGGGAAHGARLGFGCASLGGTLDHARQCRIIEAAYDAGFRHFDVAPSYGHGEAESAIATALAGVRQQVSVITKVGIAHPKGTGALKRLRRLAAPIKTLMPGLWGVAAQRASRVSAPAGRFGPAQIDASVAESLRRLRCSSLDALLLHEVDVDDLGPDTLETLDALRSSGRVRALGTGTGVAQTLRLARIEPTRFQIHQVDHYWGARTPALMDSSAALITHRCIRTGLAWLEDPQLRREIETHERGVELRAFCQDQQRAGDLLLLAALQLPRPDLVLVSTAKPERARHLVELAGRQDLAALALAMNECLDRVASRLPR